AKFSQTELRLQTALQVTPRAKARRNFWLGSRFAVDLRQTSHAGVPAILRMLPIRRIFQEAIPMALRRLPVLVLALVAVCLSTGASVRTQNFVVHAPTAEIAQQVGQFAEKYRKEKAMEWLGQEMPQWPQPCPLYVQVTMDGPSGATSFMFAPGGGVTSQK